MNTHRFTAEYEIKASPKLLFPYLSTAPGLQQWFAEKVVVGPEQHFDFIWDHDSHPARLTTLRLNKNVRFEFLPQSPPAEPAFIEFRLDQSEMTYSTFLKITDASTGTDEGELRVLWDGLIETLREVVGG